MTLSTQWPSDFFKKVLPKCVGGLNSQRSLLKMWPTFATRILHSGTVKICSNKISNFEQICGLSVSIKICRLARNCYQNYTLWCCWLIHRIPGGIWEFWVTDFVPIVVKGSNKLDVRGTLFLHHWSKSRLGRRISAGAVTFGEGVCCHGVENIVLKMSSSNKYLDFVSNYRKLKYLRGQAFFFMLLSNMNQILPIYSLKMTIIGINTYLNHCVFLHYTNRLTRNVTKIKLWMAPHPVGSITMT